MVLAMTAAKTPKPKPTQGMRLKAKPKKVKIKREDPDVWFSLCVRERADWTCQNCGKRYEPMYSERTGLPGNMALHCSHYIGRGNYSVRHDPHNADAHCYGCHSKFEGNPHNFMSWKFSQLGGVLYDILIEKSNDLMIGKQARKEKQQIAEHYKSEFFRMRELRNKGVIGRINFQGYF